VLLTHVLNGSESRVRKYLPLIHLSPELLKRALTGNLPSRVTLMNLLEAVRSLDWSKQANYLGLDTDESTRASA